MTDADFNTKIAFLFPRAGMCFDEMCSFWVYILDVLPNGGIITIERSWNEEDWTLDLRFYPSFDAFQHQFLCPTSPAYWISFNGMADVEKIFTLMEIEEKEESEKEK